MSRIAVSAATARARIGGPRARFVDHLTDRANSI